ncbi:hypothetical protein [Streptomyces sp. NPDC002088]|uniref:hypothetical protein n=1 Tax=Streptomyces sp. NPDC002088 TaxID=3154665 RepID=UPI00332FE2BC
MNAYSMRRQELFPRFGLRIGARPAADLWMIRRTPSATSQELRLVGERESESKLELQTHISGKLHELRTLPTDWDGAGGEPLTQTVTHQAYRTMDQLTDFRSVFPFVTPGEEGSVLFEWRAGAERLEIQFFPGESPYVSYVDPEGYRKIEGDLGSRGVSYGEIRRILSSLSTRIWVANPGWKQLFS